MASCDATSCCAHARVAGATTALAATNNRNSRRFWSTDARLSVMSITSAMNVGRPRRLRASIRYSTKPGPKSQTTRGRAGRQLTFDMASDSRLQTLAATGDCCGARLLGRCRSRYSTWMKLAIELPPAQADRLRAEAERLGLSPEDLARAALSDLLSTPDAEFQEATRRVLTKNQELYKRLA